MASADPWQLVKRILVDLILAIPAKKGELAKRAPSEVSSLTERVFKKFKGFAKTKKTLEELEGEFEGQAKKGKF